MKKIIAAVCLFAAATAYAGFMDFSITNFSLGPHCPKNCYTSTDVPTLVNSPTAVDYGNTTSIGQVAYKNISTANTGTATATGLSVAVSGNGAFSLYSTTCSGSLAPSANCYSRVAFTPLSTATKTGSYTVSATGLSDTVTSLSGGGTSGGSVYTTLFADDFNRSDSATIGGGWTTETDTAGLLAITANKLVETHSATTAAYVTKNIAAAYKNIQLTFTFSPSDIIGWTSGSSKNIRIAALKDDTNGEVAYLQLTATTGTLNYWKIVYKDGAGAYHTISSATPYTFVGGATYSIAWRYAMSATVGSTTLTVNGVDIINSSGLNTLRGNGIQYALLGLIYDDGVINTTMTLTWDDFVLGAY